ncbi:MAG TPA: hypothetical protein EYP35_00675, partial [Desulfobacterales bacterium]|nr:hypothetical protein [Desulfobacterales bacterium]
MEKEKLIKKFRDWYSSALDIEDKNRANAEDDLEFLNGDQWPAAVRQEREQDGRPCLQINRLPQIVDRVVGAQRQNRPGIKIRPVDDIADPDTADMLTGLIRNIENISDAEIAYDNAFEHALTAGFGFFRLVTVYADDESFAQDIKIKPIFNNFTVHFDPATKNKITMEDAGWCIVTHQMDRESFESKYPDAALTSADSDDFDGVWVTRDTVTVAEVFEVKTESSKLYLLKNGDTVTELPKGQIPVQQRDVESRTVVRYMTNGMDIIDGPTEWPGK